MGAPGSGTDLLVGTVRFKIEDIEKSIDQIRRGVGGSIDEIERKIVELNKEAKFLAASLDVNDESQLLVEAANKYLEKTELILDGWRDTKKELQETARIQRDLERTQEREKQRLERILEFERERKRIAEERAQQERRQQFFTRAAGGISAVAGLANIANNIVLDEDEGESFGKKAADAINKDAPIIGTAIGTAIAPGIGTAIGAALGVLVNRTATLAENVGERFAIQGRGVLPDIGALPFIEAALTGRLGRAQDPTQVDAGIIARNEDALKAIEEEKKAREEILELIREVDQQTDRINDKYREQQRTQEKIRDTFKQFGVENVSVFQDIANSNIDTLVLEQEIERSRQNLVNLKAKEAEEVEKLVQQGETEEQLELRKLRTKKLVADENNKILQLELQLQKERTAAIQDFQGDVIPLLRLGINAEDTKRLFELGKEFEDKFSTPFQDVAKVLGELSQGQGTADQAISSLRRLGLLDIVAQAGGTDRNTLIAEARAAKGDVDVDIRNEILTILLSLIGEAGGEFDRRVTPIGRAEEVLAKEARAVEQQIVNQKETIKTIEDQIRVTEKQLEEEQETRRDTVQPLEQAARAFQLAGLGSQEQLLKDQLDKQREALEEAKQQNDKLKQANEELKATTGHSKRAADALDRLSKKGIGATVSAGE